MVITSSSSTKGKTIFTSSLLRVIKNRGISVSSFKIGPDFIDPLFHKAATGRCSFNLSSYILGDLLSDLYAFRSQDSQMSVIEGVMGLYDSRDMESLEHSTYDVIKKLDEKALLLHDCSGAMLTSIATLVGILNFEPDSRQYITGVVLTGLKSNHHYQMIKKAIKERIGIKCYGYFPHDERLTISSRALGLDISSQKNMEKVISTGSELIEKHIDIDELIADYIQLDKSDIGNMKDSFADFLELAWGSDYFSRGSAILRGKTIALALDSAFSFYYSDNIHLLRSLGAKIIRFSPLKGESPENVDMYYFGGGYPELFVEGLRTSSEIIKNIEAGIPVYAEGGGLMYLSKNISGILDIEYEMTDHLVNFGLVDIELDGAVARANEFHKSKLIYDNQKKVSKVSKCNRSWKCGFTSDDKKVYATFGHVNFISSKEYFIKVMERLFN